VTTPVLDNRVLNRALLARQHLLERARMPALDMVEHLVGMQAQVPHDPYVALWSRLERFDPAELSGLLLERKVVRLTMMRGTVHLVSARDCLRLRPVVAPVLKRMVQSQFRTQLDGVDLRKLAALGRALVEERPQTAAELRPALLERFPEGGPLGLTVALTALVPLVQIPPRGLWGRGARPVLTSAESWLGAPLAEDGTPDELVLRYLAAFGPATTADVRTWCGLTGLRAVVERLRPRLRTFRTEDGKELHDVTDGLLPDPSIPAPPRFLPEYDNLVLSHADRARIVRPEDRPRLSFADGFVRTLLVDGFVAGTWKADAEEGTLDIRLASAAPTGGLEEEGARLLGLLAPGRPPEVRFV
jgi:Winged helix DNA-binding domain